LDGTTPGSEHFDESIEIIADGGDGRSHLFVGVDFDGLPEIAALGGESSFGDQPS
jgi:hypothetical protein